MHRPRSARRGYILRTFAPLRPRRPDPEHVPRRRARRPVPHGRRDALVLPRASIAIIARDRRPSTAARAAADAASDIVDAPLDGTRFGIGVDPADGLLAQGAEGYQLTWMDAKVDDWVVTPRRGKAVEINALWYNALALLGGLAARRRHGARRRRRRAEHAAHVRESFNARFWNDDGRATCST